MQKILWIAAAGALGTLLRFALTFVLQRKLGWQFPWGTLGVNVLGCFLFGLIWALAEKGDLIKPDLQVIILVGFMGAFTTFSTYSFETIEMFQNSLYVSGILNMFGQVFLGLGTLFLGLWLGRVF